jgi:hypothetical protein
MAQGWRANAYPEKVEKKEFNPVRVDPFYL